MTEKKNKFIKFHTEIVNGICSECEEYTMLVGITRKFYRCMSCGSDLEQHVNGKISYLPSLSPRTKMRTLEEIFGYGEKV
mgnify:CR=1 FL=1